MNEPPASVMIGVSGRAYCFGRTAEIAEAVGCKSRGQRGEQFRTS